ncbi:MAG: hypothetical protein HRU14_13200 [Planctomycetes bacterium]|nr:hypothetical protein [Planctomycetota bacterium]
MRQLSSFVRRSLLTRWLRFRARILLWLGRPTRARVLLKRVVALRPSCVQAHFLLGRIAFDDGYRALAIQEFAIFRRQALPPALVSEVTKRSFALADAPLMGLSPAEHAPLIDHGDDFPDSDPWDDRIDMPDAVPPETDFLEIDEYHRFRDLPPIRAEDLGNVDMDELLARLVEDPHPGEARDQS